jgi:hypothetical protein
MGGLMAAPARGQKRAPVLFSIACLVLFALGALAWIFARAFAQPTTTALVSGLFGGLVGALLTLLLAWIAWVQLGSISQTASADFILRLKESFFQEETRGLVTLIAKEWLTFVDAYDDGTKTEIPFFRVDHKAIRATRLPQQVKDRLLRHEAYTAFELDDLLLGPLEDVATLWQGRTLDIFMIDEIFGWYIDVTWKACQIQKYIKHQRRESPDMYQGMERLYRALHEPKRHHTQK